MKICNQKIDSVFFAFVDQVFLHWRCNYANVVVAVVVVVVALLVAVILTAAAAAAADNIQIDWHSINMHRKRMRMRIPI